MDNQLGKWVECRHGHGAYGGTWIENAVQAVARDLFAAAMPRLEAAGYKIVLHVHDEIVAEVPNGFGSADEFLRIITTAPGWADGVPIAAKVRKGQRFCKISIRAPEACEAGHPRRRWPEEPRRSKIHDRRRHYDRQDEHRSGSYPIQAKPAQQRRWAR